ALTLAGMFWVALQIDHQLALLSLAILPFLYYSVGYYAKHIQGRLSDVKNMESQALLIIHEALGMIRVIAAYVREWYEDRRFREQSMRAVEGRVGVTIRQTVFSLVVNMITATGTALALGVGAYHVLQGRLTVGQLLVIRSYIAAVYKPLEAISYTIGSLQDRFVALGMAFKVLDTEAEVKQAPDAVALERIGGDVTFEGVTFTYAGRAETLKDISFTVRA